MIKTFFAGLVLAATFLMSKMSKSIIFNRRVQSGNRGSQEKKSYGQMFDLASILHGK